LKKATKFDDILSDELGFASSSDVNRRIWNAARAAAFYEVEGFVYHDKHDYKKAEDSFLKSLRASFPWYPLSKLRVAAREKTEVLRFHDKIEESKATRDEKLNSPEWMKSVFPHAVEEAAAMGFNPAYAKHKVDFYRLHGQGDHDFIRHVYEMNRYIALAVTGKPKLHMEISPMYLTCIALHDLRRTENEKDHGDYAKSMMRLNYATYIFTLLNSRKDKAKILQKPVLK
jgi:hypothetical protein